MLIKIIDNLRSGSLILSLFLLFGVINQAQSAGVQDVNSIVAIVDDDIVARSELDNEVHKIITQLRQKGTRLPPQEVIEKQVLERLILKKLQLAAAERAGINISEDILAQAINNIARKNNLNLSEFRRVLESGGISFKEFRQGIREQIVTQRLKDQEVRRRIRVTDQEVNAFIARQSTSVGRRTGYHLLHILIATPEGSSSEDLDASRTKAERVITELRRGDDFHAMALAESDGRQALEGGDLGWRPTNQLPTIFVDRVAAMERGEISDPIHTPSGYHIVKLADYKGGDKQIITQTKAQHILINTNEITSDNDARTRLEQLELRIERGDSFSDLARSHSDDKSSAIKGGDLGWVTQGDLLPYFEEQMKKLAPGELSEPFRTEFGWHIVQVLERREHDSTQDVQKAEAKEAISKRKTAEQSELYLRKLRDEAYVDIRLNPS
ncbi:peptidylprolyl isomerase [Candidatus Vondammii sp. HM_W22]|uniref:peptidylprolyl isomerase n=1 Tax=Candidatus Vondammii sp. HM_W22 TaxID=2687299 RepID=UPI002E7B9677|nr:peptidylprolyl isomerase [Candidatus Vondammii sp. HM_W22]